MHIDIIPNRNSPPAILVRESYREDGKVKKRTLANISNWAPEVIAGLRVLFKGGHASSVPLEDSFEIERSLPHGHVAAVLGTLRAIGLNRTLDRKSGESRALAMALIAGRILFPGSKLALSRHLSAATATSTLGEELGLGEVDEHDLYRAMRWLLERQDPIEARLAREHLPEDSAVLYDLTSTYYEGATCPLAEFGHNRDGKPGKRQINIGLLCNSEGCPVSVRASPGSTGDPATVADQIEALRERFGLRRVIIVGDRGMLASARIDALRADTDGRYGWISALRSGQIRALADSGGIQPELFEMTGARLVETYKSLSRVERAFRGLKTTILKVRPIFHREEDMVRAHVLVCMLACHLEWHMRRALKPVLFDDEAPGGAPRESPVAKARRSAQGAAKAAAKTADDGLPVHSFTTLLEDLATLCRDVIRPVIAGARTFRKLSRPTAVQAKALALLGITPKAIPACSQ